VIQRNQEVFGRTLRRGILPFVAWTDPEEIEKWDKVIRAANIKAE